MQGRGSKFNFSQGVESVCSISHQFQSFNSISEEPLSLHVVWRRLLPS